SWARGRPRWWGGAPGPRETRACRGRAAACGFAETRLSWRVFGRRTRGSSFAEATKVSFLLSRAERWWRCRLAPRCGWELPRWPLGWSRVLRQKRKEKRENFLSRRAVGRR